MTALIAVSDYSSSSEPSCYVRRLVVIDGDLCSLDCPHRVPNQGCDAFCRTHTEFAPNGRAFRATECSAADPNTQKRAERALELLISLKSRKRVRHPVANEAAFIERIRARQRKRGGLTFEAIYALSGSPSKRLPWRQFEVYFFDLIRCGRIRVSNGHFFVDDNEYLDSNVMLERKKKQEPVDPRQLKIKGIE